MKKKIISMSAMLVTLAFVFSNVKIIHMPFGGSVTLFSMLIISLTGYIFGFTIGSISSLVYGLLQFIFGGYVVSIMQVILDYFLAFYSFAIVGFFCNKKNGLIVGFTLACILRFVFSVLSGIIFFANYAPKNMNPIVYALIYNGLYIFTEMFLSYVLMFMPFFKKLLFSIKNWSKI